MKKWLKIHIAPRHGSQSGWLALDSLHSHQCRCGSRPCTCSSWEDDPPLEKRSNMNNPLILYMGGWNRPGF